MKRIGVDIGGTNIKIGLLNEDLEILARDSIPFPKTTAEDMADRLTQAIDRLLVDTDRAELESVGIVVPGSIDRAGETVIAAYNLGFYNVPLKRLMEERLPGVPVFIANDANGAALAELGRGAFKGCKTAVLFTLGTGVGGGIILNGHMFNGGLNQGVELGHAYLVDDGEACTCGNHGCIEAYCSASALARDGQCAMKSDPDSLLAKQSGGDPEKVDARLVVDCARAGDPAAKAVFDRYLGHLSSACASVFNVLDPEVVAIGGGLCGAGEFLFEPLRALTAEKCFYPAHGEIVPAKMGNDAGMVGAAMLYQDVKRKIRLKNLEEEQWSK